MQRVNKIANEVQCSKNKPKGFGVPGQKCADDVVIVSALRTPLTKSKKGGLKDTAPEVLLSHVLKGVIAQSGIDPSLIEDIQVGNVLQPGAGALTARIGQLLSGIPEKVPIAAINRQCSSGLEACSIIASKIKSGLINIGIGSGVENMTVYDMQSSVNVEKLSEETFESEKTQNCLISMGETSEIITEKFGMNRDEFDKFALESFKRASFARKNGLFKDEIVPVKAKVKDNNGKISEVLVTEDDGIRDDATLQSLQKLKPSFRPNGSSHPGNSSQLTDGAAAVLLMNRHTAEKLGMKIIGKFINHYVVGVRPEEMGIGPAEAIPVAVANAGLKISDIDIFEINEAFASVAVYTMKKLKLDHAKINPKGGAIALGHPLGCTGARQFATLLTELKRTNKKYGVISMCIGTGMGAAAVIEAEY
jgi:acetyl-CoA acyltransferase 1